MNSSSRLRLILAMLIFGTIGLFVRWLPFPSSVIAMARGWIGTIFLLLTAVIGKKKLGGGALKKSLPLLILSGACIGFNWILLFEAYRFTTVAAATLCYYFAPLIVILAAPIFFSEKLSLKNGLCVVTAVIGMIFVSGVHKASFSGAGELRGIGFGLAAALLYASVILMNKKLDGIASYDRTVVQLGSAGVVLVPYVLLTETVTVEMFTPRSVILLLVVGIVHTGVAYALYFGAIRETSAQSVAILSYIDPITAVALSALVLREAIDLPGILGAILILGSAFVSEWKFEKKRGEDSATVK